MQFARQWPAATAPAVAEYVGRLAGPFVTERSVKLMPGRLAADRFLATCQPDVLGPDPLAEMRAVGRWLGCPEPDLERLTRSWDRVVTVHFGFDGIDPPLFKLYVEYPIGASGRDDVPADALFLAAKWRPGERAYFSTYRHLDRPRSGREAKSMLEGEDWPDIGAASRRFAARVVGELIAIDGQTDVLLVEDEGRPRRSYDINLYRVKTPLARHRGAIEALCAEFGLDGAARLILADGEGTNLGHVAVGLSAAGEEFVTLYYAMRQHVPR